jgi:hypothetical protein
MVGAADSRAISGPSMDSLPAGYVRLPFVVNVALGTRYELAYHPECLALRRCDFQALRVVFGVGSSVADAMGAPDAEAGRISSAMAGTFIDGKVTVNRMTGYRIER